jgi:hypothetical protein
MRLSDASALKHEREVRRRGLNTAEYPNVQANEGCLRGERRGRESNAATPQATAMGRVMIAANRARRIPA